MTSLDRHLPSLLFFISFLLYSCLTNGNSIKSPNLACPSFECGNGIIIGYPFWQKGQRLEHYCGYPGFDISCNDQIPVLHLFNDDDFYVIKKINFSNRSLTLTYAGLKEATCPKLPHDVSVNTTLPSFFNYSNSGNKMVHCFYNCTLYPPSLPHVKCLQYGAMRSYAFKEGEIPEFDWHKYCQEAVVAPVLDQAAADEDLIQALQEGFELTWKQPTDGRCHSCETSGGFCGYNNGLPSNFVCICSNGRQSINCHENGVVSTEQEPIYIARGAVLFGGLVIMATVSYFIYKKKKVGSYKPV